MTILNTAITLCAAGGQQTLATLASALPVPVGGAPEWIQLTPAGTVTGVDGRGPYHFGDRAKLHSIALASAATLPLPIDYDHAIDLAAPKGLPAPASGWIKAIEARADGLWAQVEWTARAAAEIADKAYRYISPAFNHTAAGEVTQVLRASLVNHPNLTLTALAAAQPSQGTGDMEELLKALRAALGLPETADRDAVLAAATGAHKDKLALAMAVANLAKVAGLPETTTADQVVTTLAARVTGQADPSQYVPMAQYTALASRLTTLETGLTEDKAVAAVDAAQSAGKIVPATRDHYLAMARANLTGFTALMAASPVVVPPGPVVPGGKPPGSSGEFTSEQKGILALMGVDPEAAKKVAATISF